MFSMITALVVVFALVLGGGGVTLAAAQESLANPRLGLAEFADLISPAAGALLEGAIGAQLHVRVGAFAPSLAAASRVKIGIDRGLITADVHVALAVVLRTAPIVIAECLRRSADRASAGLSAAGVGVVFAAFLRLPRTTR